MIKVAGGFLALLVMVTATAALAADNPLLGTWKLKSYVREVAATGERYNERGEQPNGYLSYAADGRMYAIITWDNRANPHDVVPTNEERVRLYRTMISYAGTYTVDAEKVIHHVDISWNQNWTGTDQVRFYKLEGNIADHHVRARQEIHRRPRRPQHPGVGAAGALARISSCPAKRCRGAIAPLFILPRAAGKGDRALARWKGPRPRGRPHRRMPPPPPFGWSPFPALRAVADEMSSSLRGAKREAIQLSEQAALDCFAGARNDEHSRGASRARALPPPRPEINSPPAQKREAKRRQAHCPTNRRLRGGASIAGRARLSALHRGARHRLLPRWLSSRTGFPDVSSCRCFARSHSSRRLSTLRADRSFCRSTGAPEPPECGLAIPPAGTATRSAFQACRPDKRPQMSEICRM